MEKNLLYIWWMSDSLAATVCGDMHMEGEGERRGKWAGSDGEIKLSRSR